MAEPDYAAERRLPDGVTCAACQHGSRCDGLFGAVRKAFTFCDFWPSRFIAAVVTTDQDASPAGEVLLPAERGALAQSIATVEAWERSGQHLGEIENEVALSESICLCVHELKRLRALSPAPGATALDGVERNRDDAVILIAELIGQQSSRDFYGINEVLFAKLATVQATLTRPARLTPTPTIPAGMVAEQAATIAEGARALAISLGFAKPNSIAADRIGTIGMRLAADIRALAAAPKQAEQQGMERLIAAGRELVVVRNRARAQQAGFDPNGRHPVHGTIRAWWPDLGWRELCGPPIRRVTIHSDVPDRTPEGSLRAILRKRQMVFGEAAIWMEIGW